MTNDPALLRRFAERYTAAWCSQRPDEVAAHFTTYGSLSINKGTPARGREAIAATAQSFMSAFPDLVVTMDELVFTGDLPEYHWTLTGTNTGQGGAGKQVRVSGFEVWRMSEDKLIEESQGWFDADLYEHQLQHGI